MSRDDGSRDLSRTRDDEAPNLGEPEEAAHAAEELEDGSLDPDELDGEPAWWDEGSDDET